MSKFFILILIVFFTSLNGCSCSKDIEDEEEQIINELRTR